MTKVTSWYLGILYDTKVLGFCFLGFFQCEIKLQFFFYWRITELECTSLKHTVIPKWRCRTFAAPQEVLSILCILRDAQLVWLLSLQIHFAAFEFHIKWKSYCMYCVVSVLSCSSWYQRGPSILLHEAAIDPFLLLHSVPSYGCTTVYFSILLWMDT